MTRGEVRVRRWWAVGLALVLFGAAGCTNVSAAVSPAVKARPHVTKAHGIVTMAQPAAFAPNYIMPFESGTYSQTTNVEISDLLWPTLYFFGTGTTGDGFNENLSLAYPPVYTDHDSKVTVTLKHYDWSDGTPVTSRDVIFFMNLLRANKTIWAHYIPGNMPDDVKSYRAISKYSVAFDLTGSYNPTWFTDDQLALIVPMPQQSWDKTSATGKVGNYDDSIAGAKAVYNFLNTESKSVATYDTNPLWRVVDGPWRLKSFETNGLVDLVANPHFSGGDKPRIAEFEFLPFTSDTAEFNALLAGQVSIGYVPLTDIPAAGEVKSAHYSIIKSVDEAINFMSLNYDSPATGALVKQLYIRQVLNELMNQGAQVKDILTPLGGYPDYGPIPPEPPSAFEAPAQRSDPYPYNPGRARRTLKAHGWRVPSSGPAVCVRPGTASDDCGAGIPRGKRLEFNLLYESGVTYFSAEMQAYKSSASLAGVVLNLSSVPFDTIVSAICGTALCDSPGWQIADWGGNGAAWSYGDPYPAGGNLFEGHVGLDFSPGARFKSLLQRTYVASGGETVAAMRSYDAYVISQAPVVWQPLTYTLNAVSTNVRGAGFYASDVIAPQLWSLAN